MREHDFTFFASGLAPQHRQEAEQICELRRLERLADRDPAHIPCLYRSVDVIEISRCYHCGGRGQRFEGVRLRDIRPVFDRLAAIEASLLRRVSCSVKLRCLSDRGRKRWGSDGTERELAKAIDFNTLQTELQRDSARSSIVGGGHGKRVTASGRLVDNVRQLDLLARKAIRAAATEPLLRGFIRGTRLPLRFNLTDAQTSIWESVAKR